MTIKNSLTEQSRYIPNTSEHEREMLAAIGIASFADLLTAIPAELRKEFGMPVGEPLSELEVLPVLQEMAARNVLAAALPSFLGGGSYDHFVPSIIPALVMRSEFYTAYTPYQAEVSQGTLQAMYEYQSMICEISDMDVANASLYDGASAVAEACLVAGSVSRKRRLLVSAGLFHNYRQVVETYLQQNDLAIEILPEQAGLVDLEFLQAADFSDVAAVVVQSPNRFGLIEDWATIGDICRDQPALFVAVGDPLALGMFATPGECGADIYVGEGQGLGNSQSFGGPYLGLFAIRQQHVRKMPGRIIGATSDIDGRPGFVLALQTREQHIRREKATSNICTNQGLMALSTAIYLSLVGKQGFRQLARLCFQKSHYCADRIAALPGFELAYGKNFFKEFVVRCPRPATEVIAAALQQGVLAGTTVAGAPDLLRIAVTEKRTKNDIDQLAEILKNNGR
ncbi:MAG: aminomethyl-transferring glycine dehydrogenase subunit GcvPA [Candidatus Neomarinimicrobiota bacterium]